jgi:hypothetical protein
MPRDLLETIAVERGELLFIDPFDRRKEKMISLEKRQMHVPQAAAAF